MARKSRKQIPSGIDTTIKQSPDMKVYRTAIYARLSVEDDKQTGSNSIENQLSLIRDYVKGKPYLELATEYADNGVTGTRFDRPQFMKMIADMRAGKIDCIAVKDLSRLGRSYLEAGDYLEKIFPFFGVRFIAVTDGYDSLNANVTDEGLIIPLKNYINEAYAKDISKKVSTALESKQRQGKFIGGRAPYGYLKSPEDKNLLIIDKEVSGVVLRIFEAKAAGMGNPKIANMLNSEGIPAPMRYRYEKGLTKNKQFANKLWCDTTIGRIVVSPVYIGDMEQCHQKTALYLGVNKHPVKKEDRIYVAGTHEPIVPRELFNRVQALVGAKKQIYFDNLAKQPKLDKEVSKFGRILFCGDCGARLRFVRKIVKRFDNAKLHYFYECPNSASFGEQYCKSKRITMRKLENAVETDLRLHIRLFLDAKEVLNKLNENTQVKKISADYSKKIKDIKGRIERARSMGLNLYNDYADGILSERDYLYAKEKYIKEAESLEQQLAELTATQETYTGEYADRRDFADIVNLYAGFEVLTPEIIQMLINRVVFYGKDNIEIEYAFGDELQNLIGLAEKRKEEIQCMQKKAIM